MSLAFPSLFDAIRGNLLNLFPYYLSNTFLFFFFLLTNRLVDKDSLSTKRLICPLGGQAKDDEKKVAVLHPFSPSPPSLFYFYSLSQFSSPYFFLSVLFYLFLLARKAVFIPRPGGRIGTMLRRLSEVVCRPIRKMACLCLRFHPPPHSPPRVARRLIREVEEGRWKNKRRP